MEGDDHEGVGEVKWIQCEEEEGCGNWFVTSCERVGELGDTHWKCLKCKLRNISSQREDPVNGWKAQGKRLCNVERLLKQFSDQREGEVAELRNFISEADRLNVELSMEVRAAKEDKKGLVKSWLSLDEKLKTVEARVTALDQQLLNERLLRTVCEPFLNKIASREKVPSVLPSASRGLEDAGMRDSTIDDLLSPTQSYPEDLLVCCEGRAQKREEIRTVSMRPMDEEAGAEERGTGQAS